MRIVGKGTFGKVFQVMHRKTKKIYAMKCIRKDVVLENEQMDSLKLEKEILYSIEHPFIVGMDYVFENNLRISSSWTSLREESSSDIWCKSEGSQRTRPDS